MDEKNAFLNKYEIIRQLGAGGMAKVYLARDKRLDRMVALKTIHAPEGLIQSDSEAEHIFQRVRREAQAIAKLNHHNIVTIFDVYLPGDASAQTIYLALEYIDGKTLDEAYEINSQHSLGEKETLKLGAELAAALAYAHGRGICHRDIKPANIMREDASGRVVLLDFSLAYNLATSTHTLTSSPIGTPAYMSPEQILTPTKVDHRTDVYSLGLVLYFMLSGVPPFQGDSYFKLCDKQIGELPEPLRNRHAEISELTERAIFLAIAKKPDERIQSAQQMADLLNGILQIRDEQARFGVEPTEEKINALFAAAMEPDVFSPPEVEVPTHKTATDPKVTIIEAPEGSAGIGDLPTMADQKPKADPTMLEGAAKDKQSPPDPTMLEASPPEKSPTPEATMLETPRKPERQPEATRLDTSPSKTVRPATAATKPESPQAEPQETKGKSSGISPFAVVVVLLVFLFGAGAAYMIFFSGDHPKPGPGQVGVTPTPQVTQVSVSPSPTSTPIIRRTPKPTPTATVTPAPRVTASPTPTITPTPTPTPASQAVINVAFREIPSREFDWKSSRNLTFAFIGQSDAAAIRNYEYRLDGKPWQTTRSTDLELKDLAPGQHTLEIVATDTAGNRSGALEHRFTVVNKKPKVTWSDAPAPNSTIRIPPDKSLSVAGTDADGQVKNYLFGIDSATPGITQDEPTIDLNSLAPGKHRIYAWVVDDAGERSDPIELPFTLEMNAAPQILVRVPEGAVPWESHESVPFAIKVTDDSGDVESLELRIDDGDWKTAKAGETTLAFDKAGKRKVTIRAMDSDGLSSTKDAFITLVGNEAPELLVRLNQPAARSGEPFNFNVKVSDPEGSKTTVSYRVDGKGEWKRVTEETTNLPDLNTGKHAIYVRAIDADGKETEKRIEFEVESYAMTETSAGLDIKLVKIEGGTFTMGKDRERGASPAHEVTVPTFWMGQTEVTVRQWNIFLRESGYERINASRRIPKWDRLGYEASGDHPISHVTWNDAIAFCSWLSKTSGKKYALPTEAMWEYACRAGTSTEWSFGDLDEDLKDYAWYNRNSGRTPHAVATKKPNPWGLYDMHGNVYEWVRDFYDPRYYENSPRTNPKGPVDGRERVIRGGSFQYGGGYTTSYFRESYASARINIGFRVCLLP